jgi:hypothetical protein
MSVTGANVELLSEYLDRVNEKARLARARGCERAEAEEESIGCDMLG